MRALVFTAPRLRPVPVFVPSAAAIMTLGPWRGATAPAALHAPNLVLCFSFTQATWVTGARCRGVVVSSGVVAGQRRCPSQPSAQMVGASSFLTNPCREREVCGKRTAREGAAQTAAGGLGVQSQKLVGIAGAAARSRSSTTMRPTTRFHVPADTEPACHQALPAVQHHRALLGRPLWLVARDRRLHAKGMAEAAQGPGVTHVVIPRAWPLTAAQRARERQRS